MDRVEDRGGSARSRRPTTQHGPSDLMTVWDHQATNRPPPHAHGNRLPLREQRSPRLMRRSSRNPLTPSGIASASPGSARGDRRAEEHRGVGSGHGEVKVWRAEGKDGTPARSGGSRGHSSEKPSMAASRVRTGGFARTGNAVGDTAAAAAAGEMHHASA